MIGSDYDTPIMYRDLGEYSLNPYGWMTPMMPYGGISYLGGVRMQPIPEKDMVQLMNKKDEEGKKNFKKLGLLIGTVFLLGYIPYFSKQISKAGGIGKYIKNAWDSVVSKVSKK